MADNRYPWEEPVDQAAFEAAQQEAENLQEVTIKFGKGLVGEPFQSRNGKELVEIKIPNKEGDSRPWESFVISPKMVHDNKFGKGVWMKLPEEGTTKLSRSVREGEDAAGKTIWKRESREVSNLELKSMMEAYKTRERDSVLSDLSGKRTEERTASKAARGKGRQDPAL